MKDFGKIVSQPLVFLTLLSSNLCFADINLNVEVNENNQYVFSANGAEAENLYHFFSVTENEHYSSVASHTGNRNYDPPTVRKLDYVEKSYSTLDGNFNIRCTKSPYPNLWTADLLTSYSYDCDGSMSGSTSLLSLPKDDRGTVDNFIILEIRGDAAADLVQKAGIIADLQSGARRAEKGALGNLKTTCLYRDGLLAHCKVMLSHKRND